MLGVFKVKMFRFHFILIALILLQAAETQAQPFHRLQALRSRFAHPNFAAASWNEMGFPYSSFENCQTEVPCPCSEETSCPENDACFADAQNAAAYSYACFDESYLVGEPYEVGEKVPLFNGVDLTGWTDSKGEKPSDLWGVEDGVIHKKEGNGCDLYTAKKYENFILEFEFKIEKDGNSGVKYKTWIDGKSWGMGCEYQIFDNLSTQDSGAKHYTGALYDLFEPKTPTELVKIGEFNQGKIIVMGNYISHWLNGVETCSTVVDSAEWRERFAKSKFAKHPQFGHLKATPIFLQNHSSEVWFRNISITELKPIGQCGACGECWNTCPETSPIF